MTFVVGIRINILMLLNCRKCPIFDSYLWRNKGRGLENVEIFFIESQFISLKLCILLLNHSIGVIFDNIVFSLRIAFKLNNHFPQSTQFILY